MVLPKRRFRRLSVAASAGGALTALDPRYLREKLRDAAASATSDAPIKDRLWDAYLYSLSSLCDANFPDEEGRAEFHRICVALTRSGEAIEGEGDVPTTLWLMSDQEAQNIAARIAGLYARYSER